MILNFKNVHFGCLAVIKFQICCCMPNLIKIWCFVILLLHLLLVCMSWIIIGQPQNSVFIRRV